MPKRLQPLKRAALGLLLSFAVADAQAYGPACHYALTFYAAVQCGYTIFQARRIASACVGVDAEESIATEPVQGAPFLPTREQQEIRFYFHAMVPEYGLASKSKPALPLPVFSPRSAVGANTPRISLPPPEVRLSLTAGLTMIKAQEDRLRLWASKIGNPGILLHYVQDEYAHAGYGTRYGHWNPDHLLNPFGMPFGSTTDSLAFDPASWLAEQPAYLNLLHIKTGDDRNTAMVKRTLKILREFLPEGQTAVPPEQAEERTLTFLHILQKDNRPPFLQLKDALAKASAGGLAMFGIASPSEDAQELDKALESLVIQLNKIDRLTNVTEKQAPYTPLPYIFKDASATGPTLSSSELTILPESFGTPIGRERKTDLGNFSLTGNLYYAESFLGKSDADNLGLGEPSPEAPHPQSAVVSVYNTEFPPPSAVLDEDNGMERLAAASGLKPMQYRLVFKKNVDFSVQQKTVGRTDERPGTPVDTYRFALEGVPLGVAAIDITMSDGSHRKTAAFILGGEVPPNDEEPG